MRKRLETANFCGCGCKQIARIGNRFVPGHNMRSSVNPNKGKRQTEEHKRKKGFQSGYEPSEITKKNQSDSATLRANKPENKKKFLELMNSLEAKEKRDLVDCAKVQKESHRKNPDRAKRQSVTLKNSYAEGEIKPWAEGLTKETNESLARASEKKAGRITPESVREKIRNNSPRGEESPKWKQRVKVSCDWCGKELEKLPRHVNETNFCNRKCNAEWKSKNMLNENNPVWVPRIIVKCDWCEKPLERLPKKVKKTNFCDRECQNRYHSERMSGEGNPAYEHGNALEPYGEEFNDKLKDHIRRRDNHTCQFCERTEFESLQKYRRRLNVHHIDYDKKNSGERNLVSLCQACHSATHSDREFWQGHYEAMMKEKYSTYKKGSEK